jgi:hypothetical protein
MLSITIKSPIHSGRSFLSQLAARPRLTGHEAPSATLHCSHLIPTLVLCVIQGPYTVLYADGRGWRSFCILNFRRAFSAYPPKVQLDHWQEPVFRRLTACWRFVVRELGSDLVPVAMIPQHVLRRVFHSLIRIAPPHPTKPPTPTLRQTGIRQPTGRATATNRCARPWRSATLAVYCHCADMATILANGEDVGRHGI